MLNYSLFFQLTFPVQTMPLFSSFILHIKFFSKTWIKIFFSINSFGFYEVFSYYLYNKHDFRKMKATLFVLSNKVDKSTLNSKFPPFFLIFLWKQFTLCDLLFCPSVPSVLHFFLQWRLLNSISWLLTFFSFQTLWSLIPPI